MDGNKNKMIEFFFNTVYLVSGVTMRQRGTCECLMMCNSVTRPVCGSDSVTYRNDCYRHCAYVLHTKQINQQRTITLVYHIDFFSFLGEGWILYCMLNNIYIFLSFYFWNKSPKVFNPIFMAIIFSGEWTFLFEVPVLN